MGLVDDADNAEDVAALALAAHITRGNFRLIERPFAQVERILSVNQLRQVTPEVVDAAREGWSSDRDRVRGRRHTAK